MALRDDHTEIGAFPVPTVTPALIPVGAIQLVSGELDDCPQWRDEVDRLASQGNWSAGPGEYHVTLDSSGRARIAASTQAALNRARTVIECQPPVPDGMCMDIRDRGRISQRAVLECFYGDRWSPDDRSHIIGEAAALGANAYVYGPSADRRTGGLWRLHYQAHEREQMQALALDARGHGMTPIWRVSPAAPLEVRRAIGLIDDSETRTLITKIEDTLSLGFGRVLIAFDDITAGIDAESARTFKVSRHPLAEAHASIINAVVREVGAENVLACPTHYWGTESSAYRFVFGDVLHQDVEVCWTGPSVISESISAADARRVSEDLGHSVWIWDNYPVNDWDLAGISAQPLQTREGLDNLVQPRRAPLAPLTGRDPKLGDVITGYGTNMALGAHMGLPAAQTALDFAWLGEGYDSLSSWSSAARRSGVNPSALDVFANSAGPLSGGSDRSPSHFARTCARVLAADDPSAPEVLEALDRQIEQQLEALVALRRTPSPLIRELHPWIMELGRQCLFAELASAGLQRSQAEASGLSTELSGALAQPSIVSMVSGMGRALAEYVRGLVAGGTPELVFDGADDHAQP